MFNNDFYPTPPEVAATMLDPLDLRGKVVLEPELGSGNLAAECLTRGAARVIGCEIEPKLRSLLSGLPATRSGELQLIGEDFLQLQAADVAMVGAIVMNPPFSAGAAHLLHAWKIAPPGCRIVSLLNAGTLSHWHGGARQELQPLIDAYGAVQHLGQCFQDAERTTNVEVSMVRMRKPASADDATEFDGFFLGPDEVEAEGHGIIRYNLARDMVQRYVEACRIFDEQLTTAARLQTVLNGVYAPKTTSRWADDAKSSLAVMITEGGVPRAANEFRKDLQRQLWETVIKRMNLERTATSQLQKDLTLFTEQQAHVPFTMRNIYRMLEIIVGTHQQRMDKAVIEVFDEFTKHTKENRWGVEGWATNEQYLFGKKFIINDFAEPEYSGSVSIKNYGGNRTKMEDLIKALCSLTGKDYEAMKDPAGGYRYLEPGEWLDWGFFRFKVYKKGTGHFEFKDVDDWARLNKAVARIRGWVLPEQMKRKKQRRGATA